MKAVLISAACTLLIVASGQVRGDSPPPEFYDLSACHWKIVAAWGAGSETAPDELTRLFQEFFDEQAGYAVNAESLGRIPLAPRPKTIQGPGIRVHELQPYGAEIAGAVLRYAALELAEHDPQSLLPLADLYLDAYARQAQPPRQSWLTGFTSRGAEVVFELFARGQQDDSFDDLRSLGRFVLAHEMLRDSDLNALDQALEILRSVARESQESDVRQAALYTSGFFSEYLGRYRDAVRRLEELAALTPADPEVRLRLAVNRARTGQLAAAVEGLEATARGDAREWIRIVAYQELAQLTIERDPAKARAYLDEARGRLPGNPRLALQRSLVEPDRDRARALAEEAESLARVGVEEENPRLRYATAREDGIPELQRRWIAEVEARRPILELWATMAMHKSDPLALGRCRARP